MIVDEWPTDDDMAEVCACGHSLGRHQYGALYARCDLPTDGCGCSDFHPVCQPDPDRPTLCVHGHLMPTAVPHGWLPIGASS